MKCVKKQACPFGEKGLQRNQARGICKHALWKIVQEVVQKMRKGKRNTQKSERKRQRKCLCVNPIHAHPYCRVVPGACRQCCYMLKSQTPLVVYARAFVGIALSRLELVRFGVEGKSAPISKIPPDFFWKSITVRIVRRRVICKRVSQPPFSPSLGRTRGRHTLIGIVGLGIGCRIVGRFFGWRCAVHEILNGF